MHTSTFHLDEPLLSRDEIAQVLRVPRSSLDNAAVRGKGPPFYRVGRCIRYDRKQVAEWLQAQTYTPPSRETGADAVS